MAATRGAIEITSDGPNATVRRRGEGTLDGDRVLDRLFEGGDAVQLHKAHPSMMAAWGEIDAGLERWSAETGVFKRAPVRRFLRVRRPRTPVGDQLATQADQLAEALRSATPQDVAGAVASGHVPALTGWALGLGVADEWRARIADAISQDDASFTADHPDVHFVGLALLAHVSANRSAIAQERGYTAQASPLENELERDISRRRVMKPRRHY